MVIFLYSFELLFSVAQKSFDIPSHFLFLWQAISVDTLLVSNLKILFAVWHVQSVQCFGLFDFLKNISYHDISVKTSSVRIEY